MSDFLRALVGNTQRDEQALRVDTQQAAADEAAVRNAARELQTDRTAMREAGQNVEMALDAELTQAQEVLRAQLNTTDAAAAEAKARYEQEQGRAEVRDISLASIQDAYGIEQRRLSLGKSLERNAALIEESERDLLAVQERMESGGNPLRWVIDQTITLPFAQNELKKRQQERANIIATQGATLRGAVTEQQVADYFTPQADDGDVRAAKYNLVQSVQETTKAEQKKAFMTEQANNFTKRYGLQSDLVSSGGGFLNSMIQMYSANASIRASKIASGQGDLLKAMKDYNALMQDGFDPQSLQTLSDMGYTQGQLQALGAEGRKMVLSQAELGIPFTAGTESFKGSEMGEVMQRLGVVKSAIAAGPDRASGVLVHQIIDSALAEMRMYQDIVASGNANEAAKFRESTKFLKIKPGDTILGGGDEVVGLDFSRAMQVRLNYRDFTGAPLSSGPMTLPQAMVDSAMRPGSAQGKMLYADPFLGEFAKSNKPGAKLLGQIRALSESRLENGEPVVPATRAFQFEEIASMANNSPEEIYGFYAKIQEAVQRRLPTSAIGAATVIPPVIAAGQFQVPGAWGFNRLEPYSAPITSVEDVKKLLIQNKLGQAMALRMQAQRGEQANQEPLPRLPGTMGAF